MQFALNHNASNKKQDGENFQAGVYRIVRNPGAVMLKFVWRDPLK